MLRHADGRSALDCRARCSTEILSWTGSPGREMTLFSPDTADRGGVCFRPTALDGAMPNSDRDPPRDLAAAIGPHVPALRRFARGLLRDADAADDLVQDCLARAISRWHLRRDGGALRPWLFAILYNLFVGGRRALRRRGGPEVRVEDWDGVLSPVDGGRLAEQRLTWRDLQAAIAGLPAE